MSVQGRALPRRATDRIEDAAAWLLVAAGLVLIVVAGTIGFGVHAAGTERARQESASRTEVSATALENAPYVVAGSGAAPLLVEVDVNWVDADGVVRTGRAQVPSPTSKGDQVAVWLDRAGQVVREPVDGVDVVVAAVLSVVGLLVVGAVALLGAWSVVRRATAAANDRAWTREWARIGPEWTGHGREHRRDRAGD